MAESNNNNVTVSNPSEEEARKEIARQLVVLVPELKIEDAVTLIEPCKNQQLADLSVPIPKIGRYIKLTQKPEVLAKEFTAKVKYD